MGIYLQRLKALFLLLALTSAEGAFGSEAVLEAPGQLDHAYMAQQAARIDELAARQLGRRLQGDDSDLDLLQTLLDRQVVRAGDELNLQAMGIVLGDLLAGEYRLDWIIYKDDRGRSRALRIGRDNQVLFPSTMISRRIKAGADVDIRAIYNSAGATVERVRAQGLKPY